MDLFIAKQYHFINMVITKQSPLPNVSEAFMNSADVLLVLDEDIAIPCHSQILSQHSAVICKMLADLPSQRSERIEVPLADFTAAQCSATLAYLYENSTSCKGAAFAGHDAADHDAAIAVVRFAHIYGMPHALQHVQTYLAAFMETRFKSKQCAGMTGETREKVVLEWAIMAEKYSMHELCGHCERAMMMYWECFDDKPELTDQLSNSALQRIAKGLHKNLLASAGHNMEQNYPDVKEFVAWRQQEAAKSDSSGAPAST